MTARPDVSERLAVIEARHVEKTEIPYADGAEHVGLGYCRRCGQSWPCDAAKAAAAVRAVLALHHVETVEVEEPENTYTVEVCAECGAMWWDDDTDTEGCPTVAAVSSALGGTENANRAARGIPEDDQ